MSNELVRAEAGAVSVGIHRISNAEHHEIRALSNSGMKDLAVSPMRYWFRWINPDRPEEEDTPATKLGSALHCAVLEPDQLDARYARALSKDDWPVCLDTVQDIRQWVADKGGTAAGAKKPDVIASALKHMEKIGEYVPILELEYDKFNALHGEKVIFSPDEWDRLAGMANALTSEPALRKILASGEPERTLVARDPETGVLLKARLDWMAPKYTLDLKTFTQKMNKSIEQSIHDAIYYERYWVQAYFYDLVRRLATGEGHQAADVVFAFVESDQPHEVRIRQFLPKGGGEVNLYWETARIEVRSLIRRYADCLAKYGDQPWRETQSVEVLTDEDVKQFAFRSF